MTPPKSTPVCFPFPAQTTAKAVTDWRGANRTDHFVQFYRTDDYLIECLSEYVADGLWKSDQVVVIATAEHRSALEDRLRMKRVDLASHIVAGQFVALDAREMLAKFMVGAKPEREAFNIAIGGVVEKAAAGGRPLRAFGEMVALLWAEGNRSAAIELEQLWNDLSRTREFSLFCAYPASCATPSADGISLSHICDSHSCVISLSA